MRFIPKVLAARSISATVLVAGGLLLAIMLAFMLAANQAAGRLADLRHEADQATYALRNQLEGDMLHDAVRSTVLEARLAAVNRDTALARKARADLHQYSQWFSRTQKNTAALELRQELTTDLARAQFKFDKYQKDAERIVEAAISAPERVEKLYPSFADRFGEMEEFNTSVSDKLEREVGSTSARVRDQINQIRLILALGAALSVVAIGGLYLFLRRRITRPLARITLSLDGGDQSAAAEDLAREDEIGALARAVSSFQEATRAARESDARRLEAERKALEQLERKQALAQTAAGLEQRLVDIAGEVTQTAGHLKQVADGLAQSANRSRAETAAATRSADQTLTGVMGIAQASDELLVSIGEVSEQVREVARKGGDAKTLASGADETIARLNLMATRIGNVSGLIRSIAERTNLLALNATIEAARAGQAGAGFSVVADEVKQLARQTTKAVEEIDLEVSAMTGSMIEASKSLGSVAQAINDLGGATSSIASATEQQGVATGEIGKTIQFSSQETDAMRGNLRRLDSQAEETARSAEEVLAATSRLDEQASMLSREVASFATRARAA